ncbi:protealysin inhibitor emfourin [Actinocorallia sp. A-T 12471]|uniref:protealysin inhibitor emfourin n=1 Tax=Actinocorallia sp. A-T 12471 TaxID=3089813 RepID=UPI0029D08D43|nr:protealysin inhibitor emfourin [Actinocorallia sp. A-T 12471]MDX6744663.1 protealysin inhibitor emfourin [Actinocorallia sp. A-T 12471]
MRVTVVRTGGFAGIERRGSSDTSADPVLRALVERVGPAAARGGAARARDQFSYQIDIDGRRVTVGESELTGALRELVHHVLED